MSPFVHVVDDLGALCGAKPQRAWVPNAKWPVTCPRCLYRMTRPRYVYCGAPAPAEVREMHIRLVGLEGVTKKSGPFELRALCGTAAGWDIELVEASPLPGTKGLCVTCVRELRRARTGLNVAA